MEELKVGEHASLMRWTENNLGIRLKKTVSSSVIMLTLVSSDFSRVTGKAYA